MPTKRFNTGKITYKPKSMDEEFPNFLTNVAGLVTMKQTSKNMRFIVFATAKLSLPTYSNMEFTIGQNCKVLNLLFLLVFCNLFNCFIVLFCFL